ncbi:hypothetical protein UlMin_002577 [Ulmus minor]
MAKPFVNDRGFIKCPCRRCLNNASHQLEELESHIFRNGFMFGYNQWIHHGEPATGNAGTTVAGPSGGIHERDEMFDVLDDIISEDVDDDAVGGPSSNDQYDDLFAALRSELYPGLLKLLKLAFPKIDLVESHYEAKKLMTKMVLGYSSIHVCKNDCALFWKENSLKDTCPVCSESRWKLQSGKRSGKNVPHKVLRYFPVGPRLKRLFATSTTAKLMWWHSTGKSKDNDVMRHPVDGKSWQEFDKRHPQFAGDVRNVRLGLAADGFNPFGNMSLSYSMWPVVLTTYNLPPWICMKAEYLMLSLLIPGPQSPVNDFPARSSLSGWSGQGYRACPTCNEDTPSMRVIGKTAYFGHRRFLPTNHHWRSNLQFDGRTERKRPPRRFSTTDILEQLRRVKTGIPGKHPSYGGVKRKRGDDEINWRKKSIFYELPYWATIELKHNLDVMHIEKNVCDSLVGTLLADPHKSKDTDNARRDLAKLGIRHELHLFEDGNKLMKPAVDYTFSDANRRKFCRFIRSVKFPDGFASNLSKNVAQNDSRLLGLKSHDCHVIMQRLLPVGCRSLVNKNIWSTIVELCTFFKQLCASTVNVSDMVEAQNQLVLILCKLERIFPPAFFDIMIHLVLHLPEEAILGGPVHMRWMYPFERYLKRLKDYVRNAAKLEGSIAEGFVVDEALTFCSRYFDDVETRFNRPDRNDDGIHPTRQLSVFESQCKPLGKQSYVELDNNDRDKAEFYILNNSPELEPYLNERKQELHVRLGEGCLNINEVHRTEFAGWFFEKIYALHRMQAPEVTTELLSLSSKTNMVVSSYPACIVNYVRFVTHDRDVRLRTQNIVLFRCKWFKCDSKHMVTENNITSIDINGEAYKDDQFILASQAKQVFYVADPSRGPNWRVVQHVKHRSIWDITDDGLSDIDLLQHNSSSNFTLFVDLGNL